MQDAMIDNRGPLAEDLKKLRDRRQQMQTRLILEVDGEELLRHTQDLPIDQVGQLDDAVRLVIERSLAAALSRVAVELTQSKTELPVSQAAVISALALEADAYLNQMLDSIKLLRGVAEGQINPYETRYADLAHDLDAGSDFS
tara:strand:+ start:596 stop:1024 length:429 start_codon:yes stop_codon:yes gene_type:complete